jgi:Spy/CpxP family protein refolding chaperone
MIRPNGCCARFGITIPRVLHQFPKELRYQLRDQCEVQRIQGVSCKARPCITIGKKCRKQKSPQLFGKARFSLFAVMKSNLLTLTRRSLTVFCGAGVLASFSIQPLMAEGEAKPERKPRAEMQGPKWKSMQSELGLTNEQVAELETLSKDQRAKAEKLKDDASLSPEQKREQMMKLREQGKTEVDSALTPDQRQKMTQLRQRGQERMQKKMKERKENSQGKDPSSAPAET